MCVFYLGFSRTVLGNKLVANLLHVRSQILLEWAKLSDLDSSLVDLCAPFHEGDDFGQLVNPTGLAGLHLLPLLSFLSPVSSIHPFIWDDEVVAPIPPPRDRPSPPRQPCRSFFPAPERTDRRLPRTV